MRLNNNSNNNSSREDYKLMEGKERERKKTIVRKGDHTWLEVFTTEIGLQVLMPTLSLEGDDCTRGRTWHSHLGTSQGKEAALNWRMREMRRKRQVTELANMAWTSRSWGQTRKGSTTHLPLVVLAGYQYSWWRSGVDGQRCVYASCRGCQLDCDSVGCVSVAGCHWETDSSGPL